MAMFIVSYEADPTLKKLLEKLERSGITVILRSCDPYINEESLKNIFDVPEGFIRVMTASNGRSFEKYSGAVAEKKPRICSAQRLCAGIYRVCARCG